MKTKILSEKKYTIVETEFGNEDRVFEAISEHSDCLFFVKKKFH